MIDFEKVGDYKDIVQSYCEQSQLNIEHLEYVTTEDHLSSRLPIITVGLKICGAIGIIHQGQHFLFHFITSGPETVLQQIKASFPNNPFRTEPVQFHVWLGQIHRRIGVSLSVLDELGILRSNIDLKLFKQALNGYIEKQLRIMSAFNFEIIKDALLEFIEDPLYQNIQDILKANTLENIPSKQLITALECVYLTEPNSFFNMTNHIFTKVDHETVVGTIELQPNYQNQVTLNSSIKI